MLIPILLSEETEKVSSRLLTREGWRLDNFGAVAFDGIHNEKDRVVGGGVEIVRDYAITMFA